MYGMPLDFRTNITNWSHSQKFTELGASVKLKYNIIPLIYFYNKKSCLYISSHLLEIIRAIYGYKKITRGEKSMKKRNIKE